MKKWLAGLGLVLARRQGAALAFDLFPHVFRDPSFGNGLMRALRARRFGAPRPVSVPSAICDGPPFEEDSS
jgi:hypothetical protein